MVGLDFMPSAMQSATPLSRRLVGIALCGLALILSGHARAQQTGGEQPTTSSQTIEVMPEERADEAIRERLERIFDQIDGLGTVEVTVSEGVVTLHGAVADQAAVEQAGDIAHRIRRVAAVQNSTSASVDVGERVSPFFRRIRTMGENAIGAAPIFLLALVTFALIGGLGWWLASLSRFWRRLSPNPFIGELLAQAVRVLGFVIAIIIALNLLGATALIGTILGGAGVIGLAIGFAVRDSLENYISSIMLSLRQPFRANDHVVIDGHEGKVVRLTTRATVLMTLDGNHLRVPNATVFKAIILNYTRNPERRFTFELGVDAEDDPIDAIGVGVQALTGLDFALAAPAPTGVIVSVGDSNIVLKFGAWLDQREADFLKGRSQAIRVTKAALETGGFTLPEPIYRLRIDELPNVSSAPRAQTIPAPERRERPSRAAISEATSVQPDEHLDRTISAERRINAEDDLLNPQRPIE